MMHHLNVGVDKGFSKTNLAVVHADGRLFLEARIEHFDQRHQHPITDERWLHLLAEPLIPFKELPLSFFIGGCVESPRSLFDALRGSEFDVQALEVFTDVHVHYGLTAMPGNAVTVACGSHWNAMYYDQLNHVHCFASPRAIWDEVPHSFEGITFARFLLAWWCQARDQGRRSPLANEILARTGLSATALREQLEQDPMLDTLSPSRWLALGPLISQHASEEPVVSFLDQGSSSSSSSMSDFVRRSSPPVPHGSCWVARSGATSCLSESGACSRKSASR
jgi:hypothetical protein